MQFKSKEYNKEWWRQSPDWKSLFELKHINNYCILILPEIKIISNRTEKWIFYQSDIELELQGLQS